MHSSLARPLASNREDVCNGCSYLLRGPSSLGGIWPSASGLGLGRAMARPPQFPLAMGRGSRASIGYLSTRGGTLQESRVSFLLNSHSSSLSSLSPHPISKNHVTRQSYDTIVRLPPSGQRLLVQLLSSSHPPLVSWRRLAGCSTDGASRA